MIKKMPLFIFFFMITLLTSSCSAEKNMQINEPFYKVYFKAEGVVFGLVVNGFEVYFDNKGRSKSIEIPINQFVKDGENKLEVQLHTWEENDKLSINDSAYLNVEYRLYTSLKDYVILNKIAYSAKDAKQGQPFKNSSEKGQYLIINHKLTPDNSGNYIISDINSEIDKDNYGANYIYHFVTMPTPFPEWQFFNGDIISGPENFKTLDQMMSELINAPFSILEKIHEGLSNKDIDSIMPLFKERNDEMDKAYYYDSGTYEKLLREAFEEEFEKEMELIELDKSIAAPVLSPGKSIVQFGKSPLIIFKNKNESVFNKYDIFFRKDGDDWIITR